MRPRLKCMRLRLMCMSPRLMLTLSRMCDVSTRTQFLPSPLSAPWHPLPLSSPLLPSLSVSNEVAHVPEGFKLGTASQVRTAEAQFKARARGQEREQIQLEQTHSGYVPGTAKYFRGNTAPLEAIRPQAKRLFTQRLGDSAPLATRVAAVRPATKGAEKMYSQGGGVTSFGRAIAK